MRVSVGKIRTLPQISEIGPSLVMRAPAPELLAASLPATSEVSLVRKQSAHGEDESWSRADMDLVPSVPH